MSQDRRPSQPLFARALGVLVAVAVVAAIVFIGVRVGAGVLGPGPLDRFRGDLQQVQTSAATYVGHVAGGEGGYLILASPALITTVTGTDGEPTGQFRVQPMAEEPYSVAGDLLLPEDSISFVGDVTADSPLAAAYREATGESTTPSPGS